MQVPTTPSEMKTSTKRRIGELVRFGHDAIEIITAASKKVSSDGLKSAFVELTNNLDGNTRALEVILRQAGYEPETDGTTAGSFWKFWTKARGSINAGSPSAMLSEVCRAVERLESEYREVLIETAGSPINDVLQRQHRGVKERRDQLQRLRDSWS